MSRQQVAVYARVSSDQQAEAGTIRSQIEALKGRVKADGLKVSNELVFADDGWSGSTLVRPALERLRDTAAAGGLDRLYVHSPDRLARRYAYQILLVDEFRRVGVEVVFLNRHVSESPEDELLLQVQGVVAEYERAKILERTRRGRIHAAKRGCVSVLTRAPYGYRYISKRDGGGDAHLEIEFKEARIVQQMFAWVGQERVSLAEVCRRLQAMKIKTPGGATQWDRSTISGILKNPAYRGQAAYGKTRLTENRQRLRLLRGKTEPSNRLRTRLDVSEDDWIHIAVPPLIAEELFEAAQEQLQENKKRLRQPSHGGSNSLLRGLVVCAKCQYAFCASSPGSGGYRYYRCAGKANRGSCDNKPVRADLLEEAVWTEVKKLLQNPKRLEDEHRRRLSNDEGTSETATKLESRRRKLQQSISRLIDSYADGSISKAEFDPRIKLARKQLESAEKQLTGLADQAKSQHQLKLLIVQLGEFADRVAKRLNKADSDLKRELITALVKHVEVDHKRVDIAFKIGTPPFASAPNGAISQHCRILDTPPPLVLGFLYHCKGISTSSISTSR
jgi:site-specific DNA recombinase